MGAAVMGVEMMGVEMMGAACRNPSGPRTRMGFRARGPQLLICGPEEILETTCSSF